MENKYTLWGSVMAGVLLIVLGVLWLARPKGPVTVSHIPVIITAADWSEGASSSPLTLIEYSDFQCPACGAYYPVVKKIQAAYASSTRFVYRHFPLPQHLDALRAAYAAEAAGKQGKFFAMHDMLFEKQREWGNDTHTLPTDPTTLSSEQERKLETTLLSYAALLGLDLKKFKMDMASEAIRTKIDQAVLEGKNIPIEATPTFYLNGRKLENPRGFDAFKAEFDAEIKK